MGDEEDCRGGVRVRGKGGTYMRGDRGGLR